MKSRFLLTTLFTSSIAFAQVDTLPSVTIGEQIWTSTNLSVSTFRDGDKILQSKSKDEWYRAGYREEPTWCYYDFDERYEFLGKLYNYYAIASDKNLAPIGWRVPDIRDYIDLIMFLDPLRPIETALNGSLAGGSLKKDMTHEEWDLPEGILRFDSSNECPQIKSGFDAIPSGGYSPSLNHPQYDWEEVGKTTYLWCITEWSEVSDLVPEVNRQKLISELRSGELNDEAICIRIKNWHREWDSRCEIDADDDSKINGYSVRLIKD